MACVAAAQTPQHINPMFGNGQARPALAVETLKYAEASVLLFSGQIFEQFGMFDERFEWAMCEDTDLSLRAQQLGYRLHWMPMPHEHWRSTSVNSLPASVRSSGTGAQSGLSCSPVGHTHLQQGKSADLRYSIYGAKASAMCSAPFLISAPGLTH